LVFTIGEKIEIAQLTRSLFILQKKLNEKYVIATNS